MSVVITIDNAVKRYGEITVIKDLSLRIKEGEFFTLLGPSGCGKTTLLRMIAGFNTIEGGDFYFNDLRINDLDPAKRKIGMVFQNYAIFPHLTVKENVAFGLKNQKLPKDEIEERSEHFMGLMHIKEYADRLPERLSGGQQQRVALARALVIKPRVLLMDEPLSNLDAKLRVEMRTTIKDIQHNVGITTVYVTHDQEEAMAVSDRIAVMNEGVIQHVGTPKNIYQRPNNLFVASFIGLTNLLDGNLIIENNQAYVAVGDNVRWPMDTIDASKHKNQAATISVRPEEFFITDNVENTLLGTVKSSVFLGLNTHYVVDLDLGKSIEIIQESEIELIIPEGTRIHVGVKLMKINVFNKEGSANLVEGVQNDLEGSN